MKIGDTFTVKRTVTEDMTAAALGMEITVTVEVTDISANGRMIGFKASASDAAGLIGEGVHQRAVITVDRFMEKCQSKLAK